MSNEKKDGEVTAMQELILWMDANKSHCTYGTIRAIATELLAKEKEREDAAYQLGIKKGIEYGKQSI